MTDYAGILDAEIQPGQPAFASVAQRQRDNLLAIAEGDVSVPQDARFTPGSFKSPTAAWQTQVLADQGSGVTTTSSVGLTVFIAWVIVPGVYTLTGIRSTTSSNTVQIFVNDALSHTVEGLTFNHAMTVASGDRIAIGLSSGSGVTFSEFTFLSQFPVPLAQCQFFKF